MVDEGETETNGDNISIEDGSPE